MYEQKMCRLLQVLITSPLLTIVLLDCFIRTEALLKKERQPLSNSLLPVQRQRKVRDKSKTRIENQRQFELDKMLHVAPHSSATYEYKDVLVDIDDSDAKGQTSVTKLNHSSSEELQLHYRQSLEYYRRARQAGPIVEEYLNCVRETALLYEKVHRITSRAYMKLMGQDVTIKCGDCHYPEKENTKTDNRRIKWRFIPYDEPHDIEIIYDTEKYIFNDNTFDLAITDLNSHDSGRYFCTSNHKTLRVYDIQIVESEPTATVFENSIDGPLSASSEELNNSNIRFYTHWDNWAGCNECGVKSVRRRVGICMVQKQKFNAPAKPVDYPIFDLFALGVPCRSPLLSANFTVEFRSHLRRPSEVLIGHCEEPCPTAPPLIFVTDETGRIIDQYEKSDGKVQILDAPPKLPPLVQRETVHEKEGSRVRISCPRGAKKSVRWQNCSTTDQGLRCRPVDPFRVEKASEGRVRITILNALLIKKLTFWDAGIFSCYYDGRLIATTKLFVQPRVKRPWKTIVTVAGISFIIMFFFIGMCYIIKNT